MSIVIRSVGSALPVGVVMNADLPASLETNDEWIKARTGIAQRYIAGEGETTSTLAIDAARNALDNARLTASDIDGIILATTTPDLTFPSVATMVQRELGVPAGTMAMDVQAVCAGFIYAFGTADAFLRAGRMKRALVIGAETMSRILNWEDRSTCVLFGDGAGALVMEADDTVDLNDRGIIDLQMNADGNLIDMLHTDGGPSTTQTVGHLHMAGKEVFRHAVEKMSGAVLTLLDRHGFSPDDVKWYVPHQANQRILAAVAARIGAPPERFISTVAHHANTSAASVPLALHHLERSGELKRGDLMVMAGFGGGLAWGATLVRW